MQNPFDSVEAENLRKILKSEIGVNFNASYLHRLHCLILVLSGVSCYQVAQWFGRNPRTIERWLRQYKTAGIEAIRHEKKVGRSPKLSGDVLAAIFLDIDQRPTDFGFQKPEWDGVTLAEHLKSRYGQELSIRQCQRLLRVHAAKRETKPTAKGSGTAGTNGRRRLKAHSVADVYLF